MSKTQPVLMVNSAALNAYKSRNGLSDEELARRINVSRTSIVRYRQQDCEISAATAAALTLGLGGALNEWTYASARSKHQN